MKKSRKDRSAISGNIKAALAKKAGRIRIRAGAAALLLALSLLLSVSAQTFAEDRNRTVRVGFFSFPGYHEITDDVRSGYGYDLLVLLQRYTDLSCEFIGYDRSWEDMQRMLLAGEIDLVTSARKTAEREKLFDFSEPVGKSTARLSARADDSRFIPGDHAALDGITVGMLAGNSRNADLEAYAAERGFAYTPIQYDTTEEMEQALQNGAVDAIVASSLRKSSGEKVIAEFAPEEFYIIVRKGDTALLNEIDYGIDQMDAFEGNWRDNLYYDNYSSVSYTTPPFSQRERDYIAAAQRGEFEITVSAQPDRDPYSFVENGQLTGIIPDYFAHLMEMAGLPYKVLVPKDRDEFQTWTMTNRTDIIMDCRYGSSPSTKAAFGLVTDPYMTLTTSCVTRKGFSGPIRTIATVDSQGADYIEADIAGDAGYLIVPTREEAIQAVRDGKADACYVYTYMAEKFINADPGAGLQSAVLKYPVYNEHIHVSPDSDHLLCSILNKCIRCDATGVLDGFVNKYTAAAYNMNLIQYLRINPQYVFMTAGLLVLAAVIVSAVAIRNRTTKMRNAQLEHELRQKEELEEALTFTNFFLDTYISAYYADLKNLEYQVYKRPDSLNKKYPVGGSYLETFEKYISQDVHPDDREELLDAVRPERIRDMLSRNREYTHSFRSISGGTERIIKMQVIRGAKVDQAAFGFADITEELREQQQRLLGAVPLSQDILSKANIGLWAFELDEGKAPRMYVDDAMLPLIGLTHQVTPEETYHAWYDRIDESAYGLVSEAVGKMASGEHAEVQYPWHHPDGHTLIVRCGGVRNPEYKAGTRIEGTHQDVSETIHYQSEGAKRDKEIIEILASEYSSVYYIDLKTDGLTPYTMNEETESEFGQIFNSGISYSEAFRLYVDKLIYPEDQEMMIRAGSIENIRKELRSKKTFLTAYRDSDNRYSEMKFVKVGGENEEPVAVALGFADKDSQIREELAAKRYSEIARALSQEYESIYYVNTEDDSYINYHTAGSFAELYLEEQGDDFFAESRKNLQVVCAPEDREPVWQYIEKSSLLRALEKGPANLNRYRLTINGQPLWYAMRTVRPSQKDPHIIVAVRNISDEVLLQQRDQAKLQQNFDIIEILASEYSSVYYIDLTTDALTPYSMNESTESAFGKTFRSGITYSEAYRLYVADQVLPEDKTMMLDAGSIRNIMKELRNKKTFITTYRDAEGHFSEMKFVKVGSETGKPLAVALGFADKDEELREKREAETLRQRNIDIIEILASEYSSVYYIDLTTDELDPYTMNEETESEFGKIFRSGIRYSDAFRMYVDNLVFSEDKEMMLKAGSVYNIFKELADKKTFITTYRSDNGGHPHYCEMKFVKVGEEENPQAVALGFADKDEEIRAELQRQEIAARDAAVIAGLSDDFGCVVYVDDETAEEVHYRFDPLLVANIPGWEQITNYEVRMRRLAETVVHPDDRAFFRTPEAHKGEIFSSLLEEGVFYHNFRLLINGEVMYYQIKIIPDEHSEHHIICGIRNVDSTVKREMEYQEKLEAANKSKTDFLFNMSHDIRTPMNAIIGFTQMAEKHIGDREKTADCLEKIESAGNHLLNLINEVLDMSRVEAGKLHSEMKTVNIREAAQKLVTICRETAEQRNIRLVYRDLNLIHPIVSADELHINQIIMNILGNAIKYTEPGGTVEYTVHELDSDIPGYCRYTFTVEDTGIGMSQEFLGRIFESFSREDRASTSETQGTGLGMAIVKRLVDYLDGKIEIGSAQGVGTTVTVTLYLKPEQTETEPEQRESTQKVVLTGKKVLLVEDNELNREIATEILEEQGLEIETAENGIEAVEHVKDRGAAYYDFVLMDIQMPLMDGFEATQQIRKLPGTERLPIIALSANAFEEDRRRAFEAGMNAHVAKPIVIEDLIAALARFAG